MGAYDFIPYLKYALHVKCVEYKEWLTVQSQREIRQDLSK